MLIGLGDVCAVAECGFEAKEGLDGIDEILNWLLTACEWLGCSVTLLHVLLFFF